MGGNHRNQNHAELIGTLLYKEGTIFPHYISSEPSILNEAQLFFAPCAVWPVALSPKNKLFYHVAILNIPLAGADDRNPSIEDGSPYRGRNNKKQNS